jgi:hypothetical protein
MSCRAETTMSITLAVIVSFIFGAIPAVSPIRRLDANAFMISLLAYETLSAAFYFTTEILFIAFDDNRLSYVYCRS